ncbi:MAG: hypothetical protein EBR30_28835 [Cytophagia bacterium]|nr:hypothetical protein [Cytophagia bacterium]
MKALLRSKHWQIFLILIVVLILGDIKIEGNPILTITLNAVGTLIYFLWPILVGHELQNYLPRKIELNYTFFMINGFLIVLAITAGAIIYEGEAWHFEGIAALPIFYILFAVFYVFSFPGRTLLSIENKKEAALSESIGEFFLTFFLPIGIWFLQPRLNRIVDANKEDNETE